MLTLARHGPELPRKGTALAPVNRAPVAAHGVGLNVKVMQSLSIPDPHPHTNTHTHTHNRSDVPGIGLKAKKADQGIQLGGGKESKIA